MIFKKNNLSLIWYEKFIYQIDSSYGNTAVLLDLKDLKDGKDVLMEDYVVNTTKDYTSRLTTGTNKVSFKVNSFLKKGIEGMFKVASKLVED